VADPVLAGLLDELGRLAPDDWPSVLRSVAARRRVAELLVTLDRPPSSHSRLGQELRASLERRAA